MDPQQRSLMTRLPLSTPDQHRFMDRQQQQQHPVFVAAQEPPWQKPYIPFVKFKDISSSKNQHAEQREGKQPVAPSRRKRPWSPAVPLDRQMQVSSRLPHAQTEGMDRQRPGRSRFGKRNPRHIITWASGPNQALQHTRLHSLVFNGIHKLAYQPPRLTNLQLQNRMKTLGHYPKRYNERVRNTSGPQAPGAPLNTTSYLMRAKKSGGVASLISPYPTTPAVLSTPVLSPFPVERGLAEEATKEWGVNGYGSMNGLIRLRSSEIERDIDDSGSDVEQVVQSVQQLEQRLDQDLTRFVLTYPSDSPRAGQSLLERRMDDQDSHIVHLEEENVVLRHRLNVMEQEVEELQRRMQILEGGANDEVLETLSERSTAVLSSL